MMRKATIAYVIFTIAVLYIISPWFFERKLLFNELLSVAGFLILIYKGFRIGNDPVSIGMTLLLAWCGVHVITSLVRMDSLYFYLRNMVIVYSMMAFFVGFFLLKYLDGFVGQIRKYLRAFIGVFIFIPVPRYIFERFGMAMLFPALFRNAANKWVGFLLVVINLIYGITYNSVTTLTATAFFILLFISPGYRFFTQVLFCIVIGFAALFIYLHPNLELISHQFRFGTQNPIYRVIESHPLLSIDGNSTWRLVLWNQLVTNNFPGNIFGLGLGTPVLKYFPVEDPSKIHTLPYVLGGHNSFIYLFARLGIVYVLLTLYIYLSIFKEYFYHKAYYLANNQALVFWSFFSVSIIALFNPALESPIYASAYWMLLGFTARAIYNRKTTSRLNENTIRA